MKDFNKTTETFDRRGFIVIAIDGEYNDYILKEGLFEVMNECKLLGQNSNCKECGCYSIVNPEKDAEKVCQDAVKKKFGVDIYFNEEGFLKTKNEISLPIEKLNEIFNFINVWKKENEKHSKVLGYTYFNGEHFKTLILNDNAVEEKEGQVNCFRLDEESEKKILEDFFKKIGDNQEDNEGKYEDSRYDQYFGVVDQRYNFQKPNDVYDFYFALVFKKAEKIS
ncbi:hypothetical protein EZS27_008310 [termite gut metagenome]|uniref:Uncharacterized protein n=1 Tax=termite gut metagenome TaxID=433724 RepID=A0A5J4SFK4_9ZZZZ